MGSGGDERHELADNDLTDTDCARIVAIDETVLDDLRRYQWPGQPDFPSKIVALYLETTPTVLNELETAALAGDASLVSLAAHRLNSASCAVGAARLAVLCHDLEAMARRGKVPNAAKRFQAIADEYGRVRAALRAWCSARL
jgi:HPt (histidine-containing phosphotransfer) domain-containing protein